MHHAAGGRLETGGVSILLARAERRLVLALAVLLLGVFGMVAGYMGQPVVQYATGSDVRIVAGMEGAGCGSHLEWTIENREVRAGSRVEIVNDTVYWQIPVLIEQKLPDGSYRMVAESPALRGGESWRHTFWRNGEYRIVSADETQKLAGLETAISVK